MRIKTALLAAAALIAATAMPANAHRQWLLPSGTIFSGEDPWVTVDAASSNDLFYADHNAMRLDSVKAWRPDGSEAEIKNAATGRYRSVFDVQLDQPGTWRIGSAQSGVMGTFKVDGVEWRLGGRRGPPPAPGAQAPANQVSSVAEIPANATDLKLTETSGRNEFFATKGEPSAIKPLGKGLEMVPITHPAELVQDEPAKLRFLVDGQPAAGLKVTLVPGGKRYRDNEGVFEVTTDADGVATVNWPMAGMIWLNASLSDDKPATPRVTARRMSYTATLEVMAP
ncbi:MULTISPECIES: DUF4198 domain-containing protein [unclassified Sphingobium]|uniref:DUF4198 domain-containing protein n=1 Tax=unclassified Sphingobium TaxID=2611147 RepID=UPI0022241B17|nr:MULTISPECIES: DUF4198 domain-containing protein [unclassified Sphingobium]MCW2368429.1 putative GH25 family protein [Sphingobium sp. B11D3D]MCW2391878.1 putative GH25 family protein [Sphingobium sp. B11D3A]